jgi:hypothetical protein
MEITDKELFDFFREKQFELDEMPDPQLWHKIEAKLSKPFWLAKAGIITMVGVIVGILFFVLWNSRKEFPKQNNNIVPLQIENDSIKKKKSNDSIFVVGDTIFKPYRLKEKTDIKPKKQIKRKQRLPKENKIDLFKDNISSENTLFDHIDTLKSVILEETFIDVKFEKPKIYIIDTYTQDTIVIDNIKGREINIKETKILMEKD